MQLTGWEPLRGRRLRFEIEVVSALPNPPASRQAGTPQLPPNPRLRGVLPEPSREVAKHMNAERLFVRRSE